MVPIHLLVVLDHPAQHFAEAFRQLHRSSRVRATVAYWDVDEHGRFDADFGKHVVWDADLLSGYESWYPSAMHRLRRAAAVMNLFRLRRPQVVLCYGWATPISRLAIIACLVTRTPLLLFSDSTWQHSSRPWLWLPRSLFLQFLFRLAAGAVSTGTFNREFYVSFGMPPRRIVAGVCPVDIDGYRHARQRATLSYTTGSGSDLVIGFAGKLTARKGVDELLRALSLLTRSDWRARIIGDGPERQSLESLAGELRIADRTEFLGFRNTSEMPELLARCDVVVVPSRYDLRVLVAPEAMAAGACVIVSSATAVWGLGDLIEHGESGFVYQCGDPSDLAACLDYLLKDRELLYAVRKKGADRAEGQGPAAFVAGVENAAARFARR